VIPTRGRTNSRDEKVSISKPIRMSAYEITVGQFREFVEATGYVAEAKASGEGGWKASRASSYGEHNPDFNWANPGYLASDSYPVTMVTYADAMAFATGSANVITACFDCQPSGMGIRLSSRNNHHLPFSIGFPRRLLLVIVEYQKHSSSTSSWHSETQCLGTLRHERQCTRVVPGLVLRGCLPTGIPCSSIRPRYRNSTSYPWRMFYGP